MKIKMLLFILCLISTSLLAQEMKISGSIREPVERFVRFTLKDKDLISGQKSDFVVEKKLDEKNNFEVILPVKSNGQWEIACGDDFITTFLQPAKDVSFVINKDFMIDPADVKGAGAEVIKLHIELDKFIYKTYNRRVIDSLDQLPVAQAIAGKTGYLKALYEIIDAYVSNHPVKEDYLIWIRSYLKYEMYNSIIVKALITDKAIDTNIYKHLGIENMNDNYAAANIPQYNQIVNAYTSNTLNHFKRGGVAAIELFNYAAKHFKGSTRDYYMAGMMINVVHLDALYQELKPVFMAVVKDGSLISKVNDNYNAYSQGIQESLLSDESMSNKKKLTEVFEKYKGKVIYVDFWASWCGPCKGAMPASAILKRKMQGKNIVFLYLGYQDNMAPWLASRKQLNIEGEHVLLNKELINDARKVFNITTIPRYAIIDQRGQIVDLQAGGPADGATEAMLNKVLGN